MHKVILAVALCSFAAISYADWRPKPAPIVMDNDKKEIGEAVLGTQGEVLVYLQQVGGTWGTFVIRVERWKILGDLLLHYENADCTGQYGIVAGEEAQDKLVSHLVAVAPPGQTMYVMERTKPLIHLQPKSLWWTDFDVCVKTNSRDEIMIPVSPAGNFDDEFTPPYRLRR